jgi:hypothetical protein
MRRIAARMLARHLMLFLNIGQGNDLVVLLGATDSEKNNLEALTSWIYDRIDAVKQWPISGPEVEHIADTLERELKGILRDSTGQRGGQ